MVNKRTRYEVLKRDNFTCRYCRSTELELTIDHVVPTALGGTDTPDNLVACCRDCNAGKSSTSPEADTVADVAEDAVRWAKAQSDYAKIQAANRRKRDAFVRRFEAAWDEWKYGFQVKEPIPKPTDWKATIWQFYDTGIPVSEVEEAVEIACGNGTVHVDATFRYFCGVMWRKVEQMQAGARALLEQEGGSDGT